VAFLDERLILPVEEAAVEVRGGRNLGDRRDVHRFLGKLSDRDKAGLPALGGGFPGPSAAGTCVPLGHKVPPLHRSSLCDDLFRSG